jgi:hypothetical protein
LGWNRSELAAVAHMTVQLRMAPVYKNGVEELKIEPRVETAMNAAQRRDAADGDDGAVDVRASACSGIVPNAQTLNRQAEDDFGYLKTKAIFRGWVSGTISATGSSVQPRSRS